MAGSSGRAGRAAPVSPGGRRSGGAQTPSTAPMAVGRPVPWDGIITAHCSVTAHVRALIDLALPRPRRAASAPSVSTLRLADAPRVPAALAALAAKAALARWCCLPESAPAPAPLEQRPVPGFPDAGRRLGGDEGLHHPLRGDVLERAMAEAGQASVSVARGADGGQE